MLITGDYLLFRNMFHAKWPPLYGGSLSPLWHQCIGRHARRGVRNATFSKCLVGIAAAAAQKAHNTTKGKVVRRERGGETAIFCPGFKVAGMGAQIGKKKRGEMGG